MKLRVLALVVLAGCFTRSSWRVVWATPEAVRYDKDGDGYAGPWECKEDAVSCNADTLNQQPMADLDCNDHERTIHPGAPDVPGDGIDQNCDGHDEPVLPAK